MLPTMSAGADAGVGVAEADGVAEATADADEAAGVVSAVAGVADAEGAAEADVSVEADVEPVGDVAGSEGPPHARKLPKPAKLVARSTRDIRKFMESTYCYGLASCGPRIFNEPMSDDSGPSHVR
jgi:hypothetical protein